MIFQLGDFTLDIDVEQTGAFYNRVDVPNASEQCDCIDCRNFEQAILEVPDIILDFFSSLGIDPRKPTEVYNVIGDLEESSTVWYNGWYHVCGMIIKGPETNVNGNDTGNVDYLWENSFSPDPSFPFCVLPMQKDDLLHIDFPKPVIQLEIDIRLSYVLSQPYVRDVRSVILPNPSDNTQE